LWKPHLVEYESFAASFSDTQALRQMDLEGCHLAVAQNCLNEVVDDAQSKVVENILEVFRRLSPGAIALVIDISGYHATKEMMKEMQKLAKSDKRNERLTPIGDADLATKTINCRDMLDDVPSIITDNVLYRSRGPIPDEWDRLVFKAEVKYICTAFQVGAVPATNKDRS
jgi:hypothetical protein